jgi:transposase-like protein
MAHNNRKPNMLPYTLKDFQRQFPDDATCLEWLRNRLYPDGIYCTNCEETTKHHRVKSRPSYSCDRCGHHVHPTADTIFHKSPTLLTTWFYAIYLMAQTRCGISAKQIQRETGVTYKTAWRMFKQIRSMLDDPKPVGGKGVKVEMDEAYFGGRRKSGGGRRLRTDWGEKYKTVVLGIAERKGRIVATVAEDAKSANVLSTLREFVLPKSTVFTDEYIVYDGVSRIRDREYTHRRINHATKVYVQGDVHTNTVEGVYHQVGHHYLQSYLNEYTFRYNRRFDVQPMFLSILQQVEKRDVVVRSAIHVSEPF